MLIRRVKVAGLLSSDRKDSTSRCNPLNVLIGPNGSGKSNLLEVLALLRASPGDLPAPIKAMPATRDIPIAIITSEARDHDSLRDLPASVPTLGKGDRFSDDVAEAFTELGML